MKVIKPGRVQDEMRGICHACGCELECLRGESQFLERMPGDCCHAVRCPTPTCGRWVYLRTKPTAGA